LSQICDKINFGKKIVTEFPEANNLKNIVFPCLMMKSYGHGPVTVAFSRDSREKCLAYF